MPNLDHDPTWSLTEALKKQVAREDLIAWALKEDAPFKAIPPMKAEKWPDAPLHVLRSHSGLRAAGVRR